MSEWKTEDMISPEEWMPTGMTVLLISGETTDGDVAYMQVTAPPETYDRVGDFLREELERKFLAQHPTVESVQRQVLIRRDGR